MSEGAKPNPMQELRLRTLKSKPSDLGLNMTQDYDVVYGALMDWPLGEQVVSLVALADGNASLYSTSTFGVIGGFAHEAVRVAAKAFVKASESCLGFSNPAENFELPNRSLIRFFMLTPEGTYTVDVSETEVASETSRFFKLFGLAQHLITELRKVAEEGSDSQTDKPKLEWIGEPGYVNCLLTLMSEGVIADIKIDSKMPLPDLMVMTEDNFDAHQWISAQKFDYARLQPKKARRGRRGQPLTRDNNKN